MSPWRILSRNEAGTLASLGKKTVEYEEKHDGQFKDRYENWAQDACALRRVVELQLMDD